MSELLGISAKVIWSDKEILWEAFMDLFGRDGKALNGAFFIGERMEIYLFARFIWIFLALRFWVQTPLY